MHESTGEDFQTRGFQIFPMDLHKKKIVQCHGKATVLATVVSWAAGMLQSNDLRTAVAFLSFVAVLAREAVMILSRTLCKVSENKQKP